MLFLYRVYAVITMTANELYRKRCNQRFEDRNKTVCQAFDKTDRKVLVYRY